MQEGLVLTRYIISAHEITDRFLLLQHLFEPDLSVTISDFLSFLLMGARDLTGRLSWITREIRF